MSHILKLRAADHHFRKKTRSFGYTEALAPLWVSVGSASVPDAPGPSLAARHRCCDPGAAPTPPRPCRISFHTGPIPVTTPDPHLPSPGAGPLNHHGCQAVGLSTRRRAPEVSEWREGLSDDAGRPVELWETLRNDASPHGGHSAALASHYRKLPVFFGK